MRRLSLALLLIAMALPAFAQHKVHLTCQTSDPTAIKFHFYSSLVSGGPYTQLDVLITSTCAFDDTTGLAGQQKFYIMRSENAGGDLSPATAEITLTLAPGPTAPTNPTATQTQ